MKKVAILGSTGSIGTQALNVVRQHRRQFEVVAIAAFSNIELIKSQIDEFKPKYVYIKSIVAREKIKDYCAIKNCELIGGDDGLDIIASLDCVDTLLVAVLGIHGLKPTMTALRLGKTVALANKEAIVAGGDLVMPLSKKSGKLIPVDSEHSAIWQCLSCGQHDEVSRILLTASGGAFYRVDRESLKTVTASDALKHPTWNMGKKVTIDSATLMNKGLEFIEAMRLFDVMPSQIEVVIQPDSIVHSMVEFCDGSVIAQMSMPNMEIPIALALSYPDRLSIEHKPLDFYKLKNLVFDKPDLDKFDCLKIAMQVAAEGGILPIVMNAADEELANLFISNKIAFLDIPYYIRKILDIFKNESVVSLEQIYEVDKRTRIELNRLITR